MHVRVPAFRSVVLVAFIVVLASAGVALGQSDENGALPRTVEVSGLIPGEVVTAETINLVVEPIGYALDAEGAGGQPADGSGHYHVHIDGALSGVYLTPEAQVDLRGLAAGTHTLTVLPAANDHSESAAGSVTLVFEYQPVAATAAEAHTVTISLKEWLLDPSDVTLTAGTYAFVVPNDGTVDHSLVIVGEDLNVGTPDAAYPPGVSQSFSVDLMPGTYEMFCPLPWHRKTGMVGQIIVEA